MLISKNPLLQAGIVSSESETKPEYFSFSTSLLPCPWCFVLPTANCNSKRGGLADEGAPLLWPVHVWSHPGSDPGLSGRPHLAGAPAQQRGHARGRLCRVSQAVERHAVCLLHSCGDTRVHSRVSVCARGGLGERAWRWANTGDHLPLETDPQVAELL